METVRRRSEIADAKRRKADRNRRMKRIRLALYLVFAIWAVLGLIGIITVSQWILTAAAGTQERVYGGGIRWSQVLPDSEADMGESTEDSGGYNVREPSSGLEMKELTGEERAECGRLYRKYSELLVIANKEQGLPQDYSPRLRFICNGRLQAADVMYDDLAAMLEAAGDAGFDYWIASGYRSRQRQQELIDEDVRKFMQGGMSYDAALEKTLEETMPAGHSEHETGLSLDILCSGNMDMDASQAYEPGNEWLVAHCAEFGFILRYPADREAVTGIAYEPWHFRYVGREAAQFMAEHELTLEEFWNNI